MPIRWDVDPGGEWLIPFAKKKLAQLKAQFADLGIDNLQRWYQVDDGTRVGVASMAGFDRIAITSNPAVWWALKIVFGTSITLDYRTLAKNARAVTSFQSVTTDLAPALQEFVLGARDGVVVAGSGGGASPRLLSMHRLTDPAVTIAATLPAGAFSVAMPFKFSTAGTRIITPFAEGIGVQPLQLFKIDIDAENQTAATLLFHSDTVPAYLWHHDGNLRYTKDQTQVVVVGQPTAMTDSPIVRGIDIATGETAFQYSSFITRAYAEGSDGASGYSAVVPRVFYSSATHNPWTVLQCPILSGLYDVHVYYGDTLVTSQLGVLDSGLYPFARRWAVSSDGTFALAFRGIAAGPTTVYVMRAGVVLTAVVLTGAVNVVFVSDQGDKILLDRVGEFILLEEDDEGTWVSSTVSRSAAFDVAWAGVNSSSFAPGYGSAFVFAASSTEVWAGSVSSSGLSESGPFTTPADYSVVEPIALSSRW